MEGDGLAVDPYILISRLGKRNSIGSDLQREEANVNF